MRRSLMLLALALLPLPGCATFHYTSPKPAEVVSECIAEGWRGVGAQGTTVPFNIETIECGYFVYFALQGPFFSPVIFGLKHPTYSVWAEVCHAPEGSSTEYHRGLQIWHNKIDHTVQTCQEPEQGHDAWKILPNQP